MPKKIEAPKYKGEFNPKIKDFIEFKNPTLLGIGWAIYWRFVFACFILGLIIGFISSIMEIL